MVVTKSNYKKVLEKIQKYTNKRRMYMNEKVYEGNNLFPSHVFRAMKFTINHYPIYDSETGDIVKKRLEFISYSRFVHTTIHHCLKAIEDGSSSILSQRIWDQFKPLIHLNTASTEAIVINHGDKVRFLPFGMGFVVITDNSITREASGKLYRYKYIFLPAKKFDSLEHEISLREAAEEEDMEEYYSNMEDYYDYYRECDDEYDDNYGY